jgi:Protein of unknown function (DUF3225)
MPAPLRRHRTRHAPTLPQDQAQQDWLMHEINIPEIVAEVREAFDRYERALVDNDVETLDALFWRHPLTLRFGIAENLYGHDAIAAFRNTRPPINLTRRLKNTSIVTYGRDFATANTEFQREGSTLTGRQSHVWVRTDEGWRIATAHVSLLPVLSRDGRSAAGTSGTASASESQPVLTSNA